MSSAHAIRYRRLALAEQDKAIADCFLSSQMNAIGGFSAPLNGFRSGNTAKMKTPRRGLSGTHRMTDVENPVLKKPRPPGTKRGGPVLALTALAARHLELTAARK